MIKTMTPVQKIIDHLKKYDWPITAAEERSWLDQEEKYLLHAYRSGYADNAVKIYDPRDFVDSIKSDQRIIVDPNKVIKTEPEKRKE